MMEEEDVTMTTPITTPVMRTTTISAPSDEENVVSNDPVSPREAIFDGSGLEVNEIDITTQPSETTTETTTQEIVTEKFETTPLTISTMDTTEVPTTEMTEPRYIGNGW